MKNVYMTEYKVKGIKTLDETVALSFYKKTITKPIDTQEYNIKGIYGMNGSGKSGIVASVDILKKLLMNKDYLNDPSQQKYLEAIVNKKTKQLDLDIEYLVDSGKIQELYRYIVALKKDTSGKYVIGSESLYAKPVTSKKEYDLLIQVQNGEILFIKKENNDYLPDEFKKKTTNLLSTSSVPSLFWDKIFRNNPKYRDGEFSFLFFSLLSLCILGNEINVYMDQSDEHMEYVISRMVNWDEFNEKEELKVKSLIGYNSQSANNRLFSFLPDENMVLTEEFGEYENNVTKLWEFIKIFKPNLIRIDIDKRDYKSVYICNLIMVYDGYSVDAEFESTGVKKLIKLFVYLRAMVRGGIVFIDEFDSNLHDVYLCALLEYLMDYGQGQLCFTTHNVGPMDVLKRHKKSIDFLSIDHKVYPWIKNGNYSPSNLYRSGMIEGSPFNVEAIDFIGIFDSPEEDDE